MTITGAEAKAARLLLGWSQRKIAAELHISNVTISQFENRKRKVSAATIAEIRYALEGGGVEFTNCEPGVQLRKTK
jgi:transcriptional regulator with XRE-family HTH domain